MHERLPVVDPDGTFRDNLFGIAAVASIAILVVLVTVTGAAAIVARALGTWEAFFYMERIFAVSVPAVKALMIFSVVVSTVFVWRS